MMNPNPFQSLVEATRGETVESIHQGAFAMVKSTGELISQGGDPYHVTYMRSSAKPLQVLSFVEDGGVETYRMNDEELSIMCASHSGTDHHLEVITNLQNKIGIKESDLLCGIEPPYDQPTFEALIRRGEAFTLRRHECSGKHTGMLANSLMRNLPLADYINPQHPIQKIIIQTIAEMLEFPRDKIIVGIDGCSAPVFAVPLFNAALAIARICDPKLLSLKRALACNHIVRAMTSYPEMVAGPNQFDTDLMRVAGGKVISKMGAEGYQIIGIVPGVLFTNSPGVGIAMKIADGDSAGRARTVVALEILRHYNVLTPEQFKSLERYDTRTIPNWRDLKVGILRPCFEL
jgi:L-asparaginase II